MPQVQTSPGLDLEVGSVSEIIDYHWSDTEASPSPEREPNDQQDNIQHSPVSRAPVRPLTPVGKGTQLTYPRREPNLKDITEEEEEKVTPRKGPTPYEDIMKDEPTPENPYNMPKHVGSDDLEDESENLDDDTDPRFVSEYTTEIFDRMYELELECLPATNLLEKQPSITPETRDQTLDELICTHAKLKLLPETMYLATNLLDRFMCKKVVPPEKLKLVTQTCLFIAFKLEELREVIRLCTEIREQLKEYRQKHPKKRIGAAKVFELCTGVNASDLIEQERFILSALGYNLNYANPLDFLRRISKADNHVHPHFTMAMYLLAITSLDHRFIGIKPSLCAAASMFLARRIHNHTDWDSTFTHYSGGYYKEDLEPVAEFLMDNLRAPIVHENLYTKYSTKVYLKASERARKWAQRQNPTTEKTK